MEAILVLEDGKVFKGKSLGREGTTWGEVVFNTSMTGYEEILSDPSYKGQLVTLTYPLIGNYGLNERDFESYESHLEGLIVKDPCQYPNHWQSKKDLNSYLSEKGIIAIAGIDTRALTRHIRQKGSMFGVISTKIERIEDLVDIARTKAKENVNLVKAVTLSIPTFLKGKGPRVVVLDFGVKYSILRFLKGFDVDLIVLPAYSTASEVLSYKPDGVLLSSGPGDPRDLSEIVEEVKKLIGNVPIFGICLGHQLLGLASGGTIYKLKFGHHGGNHPVKDLKTGKILITTQNHGYTLKDDFPENIEITHINLNDGTVEGIRYKGLPVFSLQYHPEAAPGPNDSNYVFYEFLKLLKKNTAKKLTG